MGQVRKGTVPILLLTCFVRQ